MHSDQFSPLPLAGRFKNTEQLHNDDSGGLTGKSKSMSHPTTHRRQPIAQADNTFADYKHEPKSAVVQSLNTLPMFINGIQERTHSQVGHYKQAENKIERVNASDSGSSN